MSNSSKITLALVILLLLTGFGYHRHTQKQAAQRAACLNNIKGLGEQIQSYAMEHRRLPANLSELKSIPTCPAAGKDTYSEGYVTTGKFCNLKCSGQYHETPPQGVIKLPW